MSDREAFLAAVRAALADVPPGERPGDVAVPRDYRPAIGLPPAEVLARFVERVADYRATVHEVGAGGVAGRVADILAAEGGGRALAAPGLDAARRPPMLDVDDAGLDARALDEVGAAVTGCAVAIAETGTLVLDGSPRCGRRLLSLIPDLHVCVVEAADVVASVPEALARVDPRGRPITLVSGPSATSDIELSRVEGVHGPRRLHVVLVSADGM